jgi:anionic cell wall polymer biosynthesis LytR-Cps2A-Psr (LCP) family protein
MDFKDVEKLVDVIGGVSLNIPEELQVPHDREASPWGWWYSDDDVTNKHYVQFGPGPVKLTGYEAVAFGRYREDSDLERVKRQQLILQAAIGQLFSTQLLKQSADDLWDTYSDIARHNIPFSELFGLLPLLRDTGGAMTLYSVGDPVNGIHTMSNYTVPSTGASVLKWDPDNVQYWIRQAFTKSRYARSTVEIQNGAGAAGLESSEQLAQYLLYQQALPQVHLGIDVALQAGTTIVLLTENRLLMAQDIADWMGIPHSEIVTRPRTSETDPDIVIIVGQGFTPSTLLPP